MAMMILILLVFIERGRTDWTCYWSLQDSILRRNNMIIIRFMKFNFIRYPHKYPQIILRARFEYEK